MSESQPIKSVTGEPSKGAADAFAEAGHNMLNCQQCTMFLMAYLDNEMPTAQRVAFEKHLAVCPPCVEFLKSYQATVRMCKETVLGKLCSQRQAADVPDALVKAILANRPHKENPKNPS